MSKYRKVIAILAIVAVVVSVIGATLALAQESDTAETPGAEATTTAENDTGSPPQIWRDNFDAALATELDVSVEELAAARIAATTAVVEQAVADGAITQEQGDRILSGQWQPGARPDHRIRRQPGRFMLPQGLLDREAVETAVASALGLSLAELEAARVEGQRLTEIAAAQDVELAEVEAAVRAVVDAAIQQAVSDGLLTQDQADRLLNRDLRPRPGRFPGQRGFQNPGSPINPLPGNPPLPGGPNS